MEIGEDVGDFRNGGMEKGVFFFWFMGIKYNFAHEKMNKSTKRVIGFKWVLYSVVVFAIKCISPILLQ